MLLFYYHFIIYHIVYLHIITWLCTSLTSSCARVWLPSACVHVNTPPHAHMHGSLARMQRHGNSTLRDGNATDRAAVEPGKHSRDVVAHTAPPRLILVDGFGCCLVGPNSPIPHPPLVDRQGHRSTTPRGSLRDRPMRKL